MLKAKHEEPSHVKVSKSESRKHLKAEFKRGHTEYLAPVEEREEYRKHILSISLFPNLYNKEYLLTHG